MKISFKNLALGTLIAGVAGYLAGVLTAPKSGKETRADIKQKSEVTVAEAEKQLKRMHTELNDLLDEAKGRGKHAKGRARDELDDLTSKASTARQKAREIISAIHEGDADNRELRKAMKDAQGAIKHLRSYLSK